MTSVRPHELALLVSPTMAASDRHVIAEVRLDGVDYLLRLGIDPEERARRSWYGLGAITDTGTLHALWAVGGPTVNERLDSRDVATLEQSVSGVIDHNRGQVVRLYEPIGAVDLIASRRSRPQLAIDRALAMPPIFQRVAIWARGEDLLPGELKAMDRARRDGVGLIQSDENALTVMSQPRPAIRGVPGVYRWLLAELAYHSWLQAQSAHA
jgi:hypothetical protein